MRVHVSSLLAFGSGLKGRASESAFQLIERAPRGGLRLLWLQNGIMGANAGAISFKLTLDTLGLAAKGAPLLSSCPGQERSLCNNIAAAAAAKTHTRPQECI
jgi:hypothetical protein